MQRKERFLLIKRLLPIRHRIKVKISGCNMRGDKECFPAKLQMYPLPAVPPGTAESENSFSSQTCTQTTCHNIVLEVNYCVEIFPPESAGDLAFSQHTAWKGKRCVNSRQGSMKLTEPHVSQHGNMSTPKPST